MSYIDIEDVKFLDRLALKMIERKLETRRKRKRSSTDGEDMADDQQLVIDEDEVTLDMLNAARADFDEVVKKVTLRLDSAFDKLNVNTQALSKQAKEIEKNSNNINSVRNEHNIQREKCHSKTLEMSTAIDQNQEDIKQMKNDIDFLKKETIQLKKDKRQSTRRLIDLEARSRRNNLIFYGIPEKTDEICEETLVQFLTETMKFDASKLAIQRAHRLGKPRSSTSGTVMIGSKANGPRPIIVCFCDFKQRETIRGKRFDLARPYGISEDLPKEIRNARKSLDGEIKELKSQNKKVRVLFPCRLLVNDVLVKSVDVVDFADEK